MALVHWAVIIGALNRDPTLDFDHGGLIPVEGRQDEGSVEEEMLLQLVDAINEAEKSKE